MKGILRWVSILVLVLIPITNQATEYVVDDAALKKRVDELVEAKLAASGCPAAQGPVGSSTDKDHNESQSLVTEERSAGIALSSAAQPDPAATLQKKLNTQDWLVQVTQYPLASPAGAGPPSRAATSPSSQLQIDALAGAASATISWALARPPEYDNPDDPKTKENQETWTFKASAPIDNKNEGSSSFASLNGLPTGLTLGLDWTLTRTQIDDSGPSLFDTCILLKIDPATNNECQATRVLNALRAPAISPDAVSAWRAFLDHLHTTKVFDLHANLTHNDFKYFSDPITAHTDSKIGWSAGGAMGLVSSDRLHYNGVGFDFVRGYKEAKDTVQCVLATSPTFPCTSGKFGAPTNQVSRLLYFESRHVLPVMGWPISVRVTHDLANDANAIDIPLYFFMHEGTGFTGGFRTGWSTSDHFVGGVFVSKQFELVPSHEP